MGFSFEDPDRPEGRYCSCEDHKDIPDEPGFAFWAMFSEDFFGVHHQEEGEVGDGDERATDDGGGDGEGCFRITGPEKRE